MSRDSRPRSGRRALAERLAPVLALASLASACNYGFSGGGGFPSEIRTIYIEPFDNQTVQFSLDQQLFKELQDRVPRSLGLNIAGGQVADAVLSGKILRYDDVAQNYRADQNSQTGLQVLQHEVDIVASAQIIDVKRNLILWDNGSITGRGTYEPSSETVDVGKQKALENLVQQILDGAQSQW